MQPPHGLTAYLLRRFGGLVHQSESDGYYLC